MRTLGAETSGFEVFSDSGISSLTYDDKGFAVVRSQRVTESVVPLAWPCSAARAESRQDVHVVASHAAEEWAPRVSRRESPDELPAWPPVDTAS